MKLLMFPLAVLLLQLACTPDETGYGTGDSAEPSAGAPPADAESGTDDDFADRGSMVLDPVYYTANQTLDEVPRATTFIGLPGTLSSDVVAMEVKADGRGHIAEAVIVDNGFLVGLPIRFGDVVRFTTDEWEAVIEVDDDLSAVDAPDLSDDAIPVPYLEFNIERGTSARIDAPGDPGVEASPGERRCVARLDAEGRTSPATCEIVPAAE